MSYKYLCLCIILIMFVLWLVLHSDHHFIPMFPSNLHTVLSSRLTTYIYAGLYIIFASYVCMFCRSCFVLILNIPLVSSNSSFQGHMSWTFKHLMSWGERWLFVLLTITVLRSLHIFKTGWYSWLIPCTTPLVLLSAWYVLLYYTIP